MLQGLHIALDILQRNCIARDDFCSAIRELLQKGRGKYRNIFLKGPANCGKTFLLNPLTIIYKTFLNPASTTFAWVGAESAEIIFLKRFSMVCSSVTMARSAVVVGRATSSFFSAQDALCTGHSICEGHSHFLHFQK